MCGFTISINKIKNDGLKRKFDESIKNISHRGPDNQAIIDFGIITFGHARLSIIDLSPKSNQPLVSSNGAYAIVFNGEIYNYRELKSELTDWEFETKSDTEVILAAYRKWGADCFKKFMGPFALGLFDKTQNKLILARDRMGEKPLLIMRNEIGIYFSSELSGLIPFFNSAPEISPVAFNDYLHYQYVPEPECIISGVHKIPGGSIFEFDLSTLEEKVDRFWSWSDLGPLSEEVTIQDVESEIFSSVKLSLESDVPLAIGLSAGLDSAAIAYFAKSAGVNLTSVTIGYKNRPSFDERDGAASIARFLGIKNLQVEVDLDKFSDGFLDFCKSLSEPIADAAGYGHYLVPKALSEHGFKVMLTGIGGDELFWGYEWTRLAIRYEEILKGRQFNAYIKDFLGHQEFFMKLLSKASRTAKVPDDLRSLLRIFYAALVSKTPSTQSMFMGISGAPEFTNRVMVGSGYYGPLMESHRNDVFRHTENEEFGRDRLAINVLAKLNTTWLISNSVQLADSLSMSLGVESRAPFLNPRLLNCMLNYNAQNPIHRDVGKSVFRKILQGKLPSEFLNRPKSGFVTPIGHWVAVLESKFHDLVNNGYLVSLGLLRKNFFEIKNSKNITLHTKYRVILLELWYSNLMRLYSRRGT